METWKSIPDYPGYEASSLGQVRSLDRVTDRGRRWRGRIMTQGAMPSGYRVVSLWRGGKRYVRLVHRLVLSAFDGPAPDGFEALHTDGDLTNNAIANLRWGTRSENILDQIAHGTHANASKDVCPQGHAYTEANTYHYPDRAHRACRECRRVHSRNQSRKKKAA